MCRWFVDGCEQGNRKKLSSICSLINTKKNGLRDRQVSLHRAKPLTSARPVSLKDMPSPNGISRRLSTIPLSSPLASLTLSFTFPTLATFPHEHQASTIKALSKNKGPQQRAGKVQDCCSSTSSQPSRTRLQGLHQGSCGRLSPRQANNLGCRKSQQKVCSHGREVSHRVCFAITKVPYFIHSHWSNITTIIVL